MHTTTWAVAARHSPNDESKLRSGVAELDGNAMSFCSMLYSIQYRRLSSFIMPSSRCFKKTWAYIDSSAH